MEEVDDMFPNIKQVPRTYPSQGVELLSDLALCHLTTIETSYDPQDDIYIE